MRAKITIDNLIAVTLNTTDPSALWAPPLTLGRNFIYFCSLVIPNWIPKRGRLTKLSPKVRDFRPPITGEMKGVEQL